jgi:hypothetical protein
LAMSEIFRPTTNVQVSWLLYQWHSLNY